MNLDEFKVLSKEQIKEYGDKMSFGYQYDKNSNLLSHKDYISWSEYTYNKNNNILTYKDSDGKWNEYTYNKNNNKLSYKNSNGIDCIYIIKGKNHSLGYDIKTKNYIAGCQKLCYDECIEFFNENKHKHDDSKLFMKAIKKHHKTVV